MPNEKEIGSAFRFWVELDGLLVGGFSEVTGLEAETELEEYAEGGVNDYVHYFPARTRYPRIILRRGLSTSSELWEWYESVISGSVTRKSGSIILLNYAGQELCRWNFFDSYPVKWIGPELNSTASEVAIETVELVHHGLKMIYKS